MLGFKADVFYCFVYFVMERVMLHASHLEKKHVVMDFLKAEETPILKLGPI